MLYRNLIKILLLSIFVFSFSITNATIENTVGGSLVANITPKYPKTNESVVIKLDGYGFDISGTQITWVVDNEIKRQGLGLNSFVTKVGNLGTQTRVIAIVDISSTRRVIKSIIFQPAELSLIWESDSYIPENYKGVALPSLNSNIQVSAIPNFINPNNGLIIDPKEIRFDWERDFNKQIRNSGLGRDTFSFNLTRSTRIKVTATHPESKLTQVKEITINPFIPELIIYQLFPLEGLRLQSIENETILNSNTETTLQAIPYFSNKINNFNWYINNNRNASYESIINFITPRERGSFTIKTETDNLEKEIIIKNE